MLAISALPLWLPKKRQPLRWNPACPVHGLAKRCQTQGGKIRTDTNLCVVGEEATCCCGDTVTCTHCLNDIGPRQFQVSIGGLSNNVCTGCASLNDGIYVVTFLIATCVWDYNFSGSCDTNRLALLNNGTQITCTLERSVGGIVARWGKNVSDPDCLAMSGYALDDFVEGPGTLQCLIASSTCTITTL